MGLSCRGGRFQRNVQSGGYQSRRSHGAIEAAKSAILYCTDVATRSSDWVRGISFLSSVVKKKTSRESRASTVPAVKQLKLPESHDNFGSNATVLLSIILLGMVEEGEPRTKNLRNDIRRIGASKRRMPHIPSHSILSDVPLLYSSGASLPPPIVELDFVANQEGSGNRKLIVVD
ncbi:hypothetical protein R1flu_000168 [Riccia fluitans]|uniref:Uncharacterized protein n=1 Tax=Riccia fluitans TaxID=41844 RepID=A0ABD1XZN4_9MARC